MLIALIADIHSNLQALEQVKKHARAQDPHVRFWCLGDVFGRGPQPAHVWTTLHSQVHPDIWVAGNHDWGLVNKLQEAQQLDGHWTNEHFGNDEWKAFQIQQEHLATSGRWNEIHKAICEEWPVLVSPQQGIYVAHAGFGKYPCEMTPSVYVEGCREDEHHGYVVEAEQAAESLASLRAFVAGPRDDCKKFVTKTGTWSAPTLLIVGHSHKRALFRLGRKLEEEPVRIGKTYAFTDDPACSTWINPGSVGFARESWGDFDASYALIDLDARQVCFQRVTFDHGETRYLLEQYGYPTEKVDKLWQGYDPSDNGTPEEGDP